MNVTLLTFSLGLLFLAVPAYIFRWLDRRLFHQSLVVVGRLAVAMAVMALCLYYVFRWNLVWLNILWMLLSGVLATIV